MRRLALAAILAAVVPVSLPAQVENTLPFSRFDVPDFSCDALTFLAPDSSVRLDLYVQVPMEALRFSATGSGFVGRYEVTVNIFAEDERLVAERVWEEEVLVPRFEDTQSRGTASLTQRSLPLVPGKYRLRVQVQDGESRKASAVVRDLVVPQYTNVPVAISDIMLVNQVSQSEGRNTLRPNVSGNLTEAPNGISLFFEVYSEPWADSVRLVYKLIDQKGTALVLKEEARAIAASRAQVITRIDTTRFALGVYFLSVEATVFSSRGAYVAHRGERRRFVKVRWVGIPTTVNDIDLAIRQLRYIAAEDEYDKLEEAETLEEKQRLFLEFWRKRDPSPDSRRNETMEEYYGRVEYANQHFSHYLEGWRTDMGMVFIIFGSPNNVDRHPFDYDSKPYEVWSYYDLNRQLVFVDETGFGDYRLITPIWDLVHRIRK